MTDKFQVGTGAGAGIRAGWHVGKHDLYGSLSNINACGGKAAQVYMSNRNSFAPGASLSETDVERILAFRRENNFYLVCHSKLLLNLCQSDETDPRVLPALICDMQAADRLGADIVVHQGKNVARLRLSREEALTRFVLNVQEAIDATPELSNRILLENSCQQGTELGYSVSELAMIWRILEPKYRPRVGFCLDTCHAHVGGMMNLCDVQHVTQTFEEFDTVIGLEHLKVIHFNDSEIRFDGHNDSHADLLVGYCGNSSLGGSTAGLRKVVQIANQHNIPLILETPGKVPIVSQLHLILGWAGAGLDIEGEYVVKYQETLNAFAANPGSRKGRSKKSQVSATSVAPVKSSVPSTITPITPITPMMTIPKIIPKIVPLKPLRTLPRLRQQVIGSGSGPGQDRDQ